MYLTLFSIICILILLILFYEQDYYWSIYSFGLTDQYTVRLLRTFNTVPSSLLESQCVKTYYQSSDRKSMESYIISESLKLFLISLRQGRINRYTLRSNGTAPTSSLTAMTVKFLWRVRQDILKMQICYFTACFFYF